MPDDSKSTENMSPEEELALLRKEHRKLERQYANLQRTVEMANANSVAKARLGEVIAEEKVRQEKFMTLLLENGPDTIILLDKQGRFAYCTTTFLREAGIPNIGLVSGRAYHEVFEPLVPFEWLTKTTILFEQALEHNESVAFDDVLDLGGRGNPRHYGIRFTPMCDDKGNPEGSMLLFHDLTEVVRAKDEAEKA